MTVTFHLGLITGVDTSQAGPSSGQPMAIAVPNQFLLGDVVESAMVLGPATGFPVGYPPGTTLEGVFQHPVQSYGPPEQAFNLPPSFGPFLLQPSGINLSSAAILV